MLSLNRWLLLLCRYYRIDAPGEPLTLWPRFAIITQNGFLRYHLEITSFSPFDRPSCAIPAPIIGGGGHIAIGYSPLFIPSRFSLICFRNPPIMYEKPPCHERDIVYQPEVYIQDLPENYPLGERCLPSQIMKNEKGRYHDLF